MRPHLIQKRKENKLNQGEIAKFLGITNQHYQRLEAGTSGGSVRIWQQLAQKFNTTIDYLLEQVDDGQENCNTSAPFGTDIKSHLEEGERAVEVLGKAVEIVKCHNRTARLMKDYGENGQVNSEEFRPIFEELREVVNGAFV